MPFNSIVTSWVLLVTIKWRIGGYWKLSGSFLGRFNPTLLFWTLQNLPEIRTCLSLLLFLSHKVQSSRGWGENRTGHHSCSLILLEPWARVMDHDWQATVPSLKSMAVITARLRLTVPVLVFLHTMTDCPKLALDVSPNSYTFSLTACLEAIVH